MTIVKSILLSYYTGRFSTNYSIMDKFLGIPDSKVPSEEFEDIHVQGLNTSMARSLKVRFRKKKTKATYIILGQVE